jgi:hypothetical protein
MDYDWHSIIERLGRHQEQCVAWGVFFVFCCVVAVGEATDV